MKIEAGGKLILMKVICYHPPLLLSNSFDAIYLQRVFGLGTWRCWVFRDGVFDVIPFREIIMNGKNRGLFPLHHEPWSQFALAGGDSGPGLFVRKGGDLCGTRHLQRGNVGDVSGVSAAHVSGWRRQRLAHCGRRYSLTDSLKLFSLQSYIWLIDLCAQSIKNDMTVLNMTSRDFRNLLLSLTQCRALLNDKGTTLKIRRTIKKRNQQVRTSATTSYVLQPQNFVLFHSAVLRWVCSYPKVCVHAAVLNLLKTFISRFLEVCTFILGNFHCLLFFFKGMAAGYLRKYNSRTDLTRQDNRMN